MTRKLCPAAGDPGGGNASSSLGRVSPGDAYAWSASIRALAACEAATDLAAPGAPVAASGTTLTTASLGLLRSLMAEFGNATGLRFNLTPVPSDAYFANRYRIANTIPTANDPGPYDFWMVSAEIFGMPELSDTFLDTTLSLANNKDFQLTDIPSFYRFAMSGAALGSYSSVPAAWAGSYFFYQPRLFQQHNISVPHTWQDVVEVAEKYHGQDLNGDGQREIGICMDVSQSCGIYMNTLLVMLASMIQARGPTDGVILDPDTLELLAAGEPLREALRLFARLQAVSIPADMPCYAFYTQLHAKGRCLMTIGLPIAYKLASHARFPGPLQGNTRTMPVPGSARVLDRPSGRLVPCTPERCPYATRVVRPGSGEEEYVNKVNWIDTASVAINRHMPLYRQAAALRLLSYMFGPIGSKAIAMAPTIEAGILRYSQLDLDEWLAAGYERSNTQSYLEQTVKMLDFPNPFLELRFPGIFDVQDRMTDLIRSVVWGNASVEAAEAKWAADMRAIVEARGGVRGLGPAYRRSLGILTISPKLLEMARGAASSGGSGSATDVGTVVPAVLVPVVVVLLLALLAALLFVRRARQKVLKKRLATTAPGPGWVVLCVTDIENSTTLWETLPADVCQSAIQLHHTTIRRAADAFNGYESQTEGDSFILAWTSATDCARFCLHVQEALCSPDTPWPAALLASPLAGVVTLQPPQLSAAQQQALRAMCGPSILTSLLRPATAVGNVAAAGAGIGTGGGTQSGMRRVTDAGMVPDGSAPAEASAFAGMPAAVAEAAGGERSASAAVDGGDDDVRSGGVITATATAATDHSDALTFSHLAAARGTASKPLSFVNFPALITHGSGELAAVAGGGSGRQHSADLSAATGHAGLIASGRLPRAAQQPAALIDGLDGVLVGDADVSCGGEAAGSTEPYRAPARPRMLTDAGVVAASAACWPGASADVGGGGGQRRVALAAEHLTQTCTWDADRLESAVALPVLSSVATAGAAAEAGPVEGDGAQQAAEFGRTRLLPSTPLAQLLRECLGVAEQALLLQAAAAAGPSAGEDGSRSTPTQTVDALADGRCVFRGLRVRIGFHGGRLSESEVSFNRASQRTVYSGSVARAAKAVGDVGRGGQIMASAHTLAAVSPSLLRSDTLLVLHAGRHVIKEDDTHDTELYCLYGRALAARAAVVEPPRSHLVKVPGSLSAPLGRLAVALLQVGDSSATSRGLEATAGLFSLARTRAQERAAELGGYLLLTSPGTLQATFTTPLASVQWMLEIQDLVLSWNDAAVAAAEAAQTSVPSAEAASPTSTNEHNLGDAGELLTAAAAAGGELQLSARGGADVGSLQASFTADGWVSYSGGACKRVACMTARAAWGAALVSVELARKVLGPGHPQLEAIEEACAAAGVGKGDAAVRRAAVAASNILAATPKLSDKPSGGVSARLSMLSMSLPRTAQAARSLLFGGGTGSGAVALGSAGGSGHRRRSSAFSPNFASVVGMPAGSAASSSAQRHNSGSGQQPFLAPGLLAAPPGDQQQVSPGQQHSCLAPKSRRRSIASWFNPAAIGSGLSSVATAPVWALPSPSAFSSQQAPGSFHRAAHAGGGRRPSIGSRTVENAGSPVVAAGRAQQLPQQHTPARGFVRKSGSAKVLSSAAQQLRGLNETAAADAAAADDDARGSNGRSGGRTRLVEEDAGTEVEEVDPLAALQQMLGMEMEGGSAAVAASGSDAASGSQAAAATAPPAGRAAAHQIAEGGKRSSSQGPGLAGVQHPRGGGGPASSEPVVMPRPLAAAAGHAAHHPPFRGPAMVRTGSLLGQAPAHLPCSLLDQALGQAVAHVSGMPPLPRAASDGEAAAPGPGAAPLGVAAASRSSASNRLPGTGGGGATAGGSGFGRGCASQSVGAASGRGVREGPAGLSPGVGQQARTLLMPHAASGGAGGSGGGIGHAGSSFHSDLGRSGSDLLVTSAPRTVGSPSGSAGQWAIPMPEARYAPLTATAAGPSNNVNASPFAVSSMNHVESTKYSYSQLADLPEHEALNIPDLTPSNSALITPFGSMHLAATGARRPSAFAMPGGSGLGASVRGGGNGGGGGRLLNDLMPFASGGSGALSLAQAGSGGSGSLRLPSGTSASGTPAAGDTRVAPPANTSQPVSLDLSATHGTTASDATLGQLSQQEQPQPPGAQVARALLGRWASSRLKSGAVLLGSPSTAGPSPSPGSLVVGGAVGGSTGYSGASAKGFIPGASGLSSGSMASTGASYSHGQGPWTTAPAASSSLMTAGAGPAAAAAAVPVSTDAAAPILARGPVSVAAAGAVPSHSMVAREPQPQLGALASSAGLLSDVGSAASRAADCTFESRVAGSSGVGGAPNGRVLAGASLRRLMGGQAAGPGLVTTDTYTSTRTHSGPVLSGFGIGSASGDGSSPRGILVAVQGEAATRSPACVRSSKRVGWADDAQQQAPEQQLPIAAMPVLAPESAMEATLGAAVDMVTRLSPQSSRGARALQPQPPQVQTLPALADGTADGGMALRAEGDTAGKTHETAPDGAVFDSVGLVKLLEATAAAAAGPGGGLRAGRLADIATTELVLLGQQAEAGEGEQEGELDAVAAADGGGGFPGELLSTSGAALLYHHTILEGEEGQAGSEAATGGGGVEAERPQQPLADLAVLMVPGSDPTAGSLAPAAQGPGSSHPDATATPAADAGGRADLPCAGDATLAAVGETRASLFQTVQLSGLPYPANQSRPPGAGGATVGRLSTDPTASVLFEPPLSRSRFDGRGQPPPRQQQAQHMQQAPVASGRRARAGSVVLCSGASASCSPMLTFSFAGVIKVKGKGRIPVAWVTYAGGAGLEQTS
ncbi:hypothetical protein HYH02_001187 [Chlamydomonas schloesseri]|uniref:Guanylate cyclase domain-containing protein n=1 Tax=Chlamydomonas schloesseri TaxID=2026947 RepID=A0A835WV06_9CHLO|nr:hypothetical protein HYH02_001187 [Chlamydomonas schloesseri]|eukprot:KAG2454151.1 hypothetical protein HYH02_001187 [Chlamydomonas schloesseri]